MGSSSVNSVDFRAAAAGDAAQDSADAVLRRGLPRVLAEMPNYDSLTH
jgi:hypothetical protein